MHIAQPLSDQDTHWDNGPFRIVWKSFCTSDAICLPISSRLCAQGFLCNLPPLWASSRSRRRRRSRRSGRKHFQALSPPRHTAQCTWVPTCPIGAQNNILRSIRAPVDLYIMLSMLDPCTSIERFFSVDTGLWGVSGSTSVHSCWRVLSLWHRI